MISHLLAAAVTGIVLGASNMAHAQTSQLDTLDHDNVQQLDTNDGAKHGCKGKNACKGQGGCKTDKNSCKGKNACKGQDGCKTDAAPKDKNACSSPSGCGTK